MPDAVICGAGIAGLSAARFLTRAGLRDVLLVDEGEPLGLTSSRSTECYRNWWPGVEMAALMNRSIDLLEELALESGNAFRMNRRGYLYLTADPARAAEWRETAAATVRAAGGTLRVHRGAPDDPPYQTAAAEGWQGQPDGADLLLDPALIRKQYPRITERVVAGLHVRRAGWLNAHGLGQLLFDQARAGGARLQTARVIGLEVSGGKLHAVRLNDGSRITTGVFVNAAGPFFRAVGELAGLRLPVHTELHLKAGFRDTRGALDRHAPLLIWSDPQRLPWNEAERASLSADAAVRWLLDEFPAGAHTRPEGGVDSPMALMLWEYRTEVCEPVWPPPLDPLYPEIVLRGLSAMLPGLRAYFDRLPQPILDGGYYTRTPENRPLIGPTEVEGVYLLGALSGYGIMSACAAGELLAAHVTGAPVPAYAPAFSISRYDDPDYRRRLQTWSEGGQL